MYRPAHESKEKQWAQKLETRQTYRGDRSVHRTLWTAGRNLETRKRRFVKRLRGLRPWRPQLRLLMPNLCRGRGTRRGFRLGTAESARHNRTCARCSTEITMYTNNTQTDDSRRGAFAGKGDATRRCATPNACCASTPTLRREDAVHFRAESIRSLP